MDVIIASVLLAVVTVSAGLFLIALLRLAIDIIVHGWHNNR